MPAVRFSAFLAILMMTVLAGMGIVELWRPALLSGGIFIKVGGTFGVLVALAFLVNFITGLVADKNAAENSTEEQK